jgi:membrane protease YdiL (CAAX protease family)
MITDTSLGSENHLVALARRARRLPNLVLTLIVGLAILVGGEALFGLPAVLLLSTLAGTRPRELVEGASGSPIISGLYWATVLVVAFAGTYLLLWIWLRLYERRPFWTLGLEPSGAGWKVVRGALSGLIMMGAAVGLLALAGLVEPEGSAPELVGWSALPGVLIVLLGWAVQGPAEEAVCRGWMLPVIAARYRLWLGVAVSAAFFAAAHALNPGIGPIAVVNLALYGLFAALYALREGGIWGIAPNHAVWNWAQGNLFGLEVSGTPSAGGMLVNLIEIGPDEMTGGTFGPEGGLAVTLVLLAAIAVLLTRPRRGRRGPMP